MKLTLKSQILIPFLVLIFTTSVAIIGSVFFATKNNINLQLKESLYTGKNVFERLMAIRGDQLIDSSEVMVSDFGFKAAIASSDKNTILSALDNYQQRTDVDLMMIHNIDGSLLANTLNNDPQDSSLSQKDIKTIKKEGGLLTTMVINSTAYQVAILPVKAPTTIAWATIGVAINTAFAEELKKLTNLDVSFIGSNNKGELFTISTLPEIMSADASDNGNDLTEIRHFYSDNKEEFISLSIVIHKLNDYQINAHIFTSLTKAYAQYTPLQWQILGISILALLTSALGALSISKNVTKPIAFFVKIAKQISDGDYTDDKAHKQRNTTEIITLENSFKKMQKGIADRESKILHQAYHDTLTGLPNRTQIKEYITSLIEDSSTTEFTVISINIAGFSQINDAFGFDVGDDFLKTFSKRLEKLTSTPGLSARLSADNFITILPTTCTDSVPKSAHTIQAALEKNINLSNIDIAVSVRLGAASYPEQGDTAEQLLRRSGIALNVAETYNRSLSFYETGEDQQYMKRIRLISDLGDAIKNNDLVMFYQPKIDLHSQSISQVEALIRWIHKDLGFIPPDDFIGLAESSGMMPDLTRWVLSSVAAQASEWRKQNVNAVVAVNLSAHDLAHDGLPSFITELLREHSLNASDIMLEITESAVMDNPEHAIEVLESFKALGIDLSIDDFGTGYSSLSQLKSMPVDELKIDKSFILNLPSNKDDQIIVQSTIQLGHNIGLRIVAEGVETIEAWHLLEQWGCDKLQGYFISKPMPAEDFAQWYAQYDPAEHCITPANKNVESLLGNS
ncbi:hypothetical protein A9Q99_02160 [Gammaproteobacteria bacterium 45_16_T64]|nr:hypothetical protein A9Q99_02160 [Gammaproteobacteria bacterium 45_16_T64]